MPTFLDIAMSSSNRRDFIKILIGGTGASFLTLGASSCGKINNDHNLKDITGHNHQTILKRQRFALAHEYIRGNAYSSSQKVAKVVKCEVLIIGAGASGLVSAMTLQDNGIHAIMVENESRPGGAGVKGIKDGVHYPYGSVYFVNYDEEIKEICTKAGVKPIDAPEDAVFYQGNLIENIWNDTVIDSLKISHQEKEGLKRFKEFVLNENNIPIYPLQKKLSARDSALDAQTGREFLLQFKSTFLESLINLYSKSSLGAGIDDVNAFCLLNFYGSELGKEFGLNRYTFPGGMNELYQGMANYLHPKNQMYNHLIFSIKNTHDGISALCIDENLEIIEFQAKYALMSGQKHIASHIVQSLPNEQKSAMQAMKYPPYCTIHVKSSKELFPNHIMDVWTMDTNTQCTDIICSNAMKRDNSPAQSYIYSIYGSMSHTNRNILLDDSALATHALKLVDSTSDYLNNQMMDSISEIEVFAWGHALAIPFPGSHNGIAQTASKQFGNIIFSASDNDAASSFENAFYYGLHSAENIIKYL